MKFNVQVLFLCLFIMLAFGLRASDLPYVQFESFTNENGLPNNKVYQIVKDTSGLVWMATVSGLVRYDGAKFEVIKHKESDENTPIGNMIERLFVDSKNRLWIGTRGSGLSCLNIENGTYRHFVHDENDGNSISNNDILSILEDTKGRMWIGTEDGLNVIEANGENLTTFRHNPDDPKSLAAPAVLSILEDSKGRMWVGTWGGGLHLFMPNELSFNRSNFKSFRSDTLQNHALTNNNVWTLFEDSQSRIWVGTFGGGLHLMILNESAKKIEAIEPQFIAYQNAIDDPNTLPNNDIYSLTEDDEAHIWVATGSGLAIFNARNVGKTKFIDANITGTHPKLYFESYKGDVTDISLISDLVRDVYIDESKSLWISTFGGVSKYDKLGLQFDAYFNTRDTKSTYSVDAIFPENATTHWLGVWDLGLVKYNPKNKAYTVYRGEGSQEDALNDDDITTLTQLSDNNLWIGTNTGYAVFNKSTKKFKNYAILTEHRHRVNTILEDSRGIIWLGTNHGLARLYPNENNPEEHEYEIYTERPNTKNTLSSNDIHTIIEDKYGRIWAGTFSGLNKIQINKQEQLYITQYRHSSNDTNTIANDRIQDLCLHNDEIWIAHETGISVFDPKNNNFRNNSNPYDRASSAVVIELDDSGTAWVATENGLYNYKPQTNEYRFFDRNDGLQSNKFNNAAAYKDDKGHLYFGGSRGYNRFNPQDIIPNKNVPNIIITGIKIFDNEQKIDQLINEEQKIILDHNQNFFTIEFAALNYIQSHQNQYKFMLEGLDNDWIPNGNKTFTNYTNLDGGEYTFKVIGSNNDDTWNNKGAKLKIEVVPPFTQTIPFYILTAFALVFIIVSLIRYRHRNIVQRNSILQDHNEKLNVEIQVRQQTEERLRQREQNLREAETRLENTVQELKRSNKELEQFAYIASHDLQEPLRMVTSFVQLLDKEYTQKIDNNGKEYIRYTIDAVERMSGLIKGLLSFSRLGKQSANFKNTDLNLILEKKMLDLSKYIKDQNAQINISPLPNSVYCDPVQISAVFHNLTVNAIKFNKNSQPQVTIQLRKNTPKKWMFSVTDNGIGINPQYKDTVFEVFKRLNTRDEFKGFGIGLSLCKRIIENHNGNIWFDSTPEQGTTFYFTINKDL